MKKQNLALIRIVLFVCAIWVVRTAWAGGALQWFGNDARNAAMGGGGYVLGTGPGNLLVNPSLMSFSNSGVWLSFSAAPSLLYIHLKDRPAGFDVPETVYQADADDWPDRPIPTSLLTNSRGDTEDLDAAYLLNIAAIGSFGFKRFRAGLGATFPVPSLMTFKTWYNDEREQHFSNRLHFERFGEFDNLLTIYPALSYAPLDWLSLGMALKLDLAMEMGTGIYLPQGDQWEYAYIAPSGEVVPAFRPVAALAVKTPIGLSFGAVYKYQSYMDIDLDVQMRIWSVEQGQEGPQNQFTQTHHYTVGYEPSEAALAAAYERGIFKVEVGSTWQHWSNYKDRHGNDWSHPVWEEPEGEWEDPEFDNVFTVHGGAELQVAEPAALRAGLAYYPSPMPSSVGRYNYVDNDILLYSLGAGFRFDVLGRTMTADVAGQVWHMRELSVNKRLPAELLEREGGLVDEVPDDMTDYNTGELLEGAAGLQTNNPGFPGYTVGGVAFNIALMIGIELD